MTDLPAPGTDPRGFLIGLFRLAVDQADPMRVIPAHLPARPARGRIVVIGAGKASARMAEAVEAIWGPCQGLVITRYGYARPTQGIEIVEAAHPVPDQAGVDATGRMLDLVTGLGPDDLVLALISGGGSALLCAPAEGLSLADKQAFNAALLASGAPIAALNLLRARISQVKGGRLAAACHPARVVSLLISDVPGDAPDQIASGPTVAAPTRDVAGAVAAALERWPMDLPDRVRACLRDAPPPVSADDPRLAGACATVIAAPSQSLEAAAHAARVAGCEVRILGDALEGEALDLAREQVVLAREIQAAMAPGDAPVLLLSGGECTVTRRGDGVGGPNAEFTLAAALALNGQPGIHVLAGDTDGVDGAAEVAGAYAGPDALQATRHQAETALARNDAHSFFGRTGGQIVTGPTLTNVNDFRALLIMPDGA